MSQKVVVLNDAKPQRAEQTAIMSRDLSFVYSEVVDLSVDLDIPICALTVAGRHFQYVKVSVGTDLVLMHRDHAFCSHTMHQSEMMVVDDTAKDARFRDNPYVVDGPRIRFYAGAPLLTPKGQALGAVCLMDDKPRTLSAKGRSRLMDATDAITAKLRLKEREPPLAQLRIKELLFRIRSETNYMQREKTIELIDALYSRFDNLHSPS